ncbi:MAG: hypothetical protein EHM85_16165 [Desulfobacteraceae bacterium]|nr:MAG: hypothetical protein EHM85_16165 [Desulfobacteraceae bacterium]
MSLGYYFKKAVRTIDGTAPSDLVDLKRHCRKIQEAEEKLFAVGRSAFRNCYTGCSGLCCRNVAIDEIIGFPDFIYILTLAGHLRETMTICLEKENRLFASDCIFLLNGKGPCIFPPAVRPEVCITTFCANAIPVNMEVRHVKYLFFKLNLYILFLRAKNLINRIYYK